MPKEDQQFMSSIHQFCFPDTEKFPLVKISNKNKKFTFVVTNVDGTKRFGYCNRHLIGDINLSNKGKRFALCYCIISLYPCHAIFDKILEVANTLSKESLMVMLYKLYRETIPAPGDSLQIHLPHQVDEKIITLTRPQDDLSLTSFASFDVLLKYLDSFTIYTVIISMLLERRIIFTSKKLSILSNCVQSFLAFISPFVWQHVFIPVLPVKMIPFVCAPVPFIVGLLELHLDKVSEHADAMEEVMFVDLDRSNIYPPSMDILLLGDEYMMPFLNCIQQAKNIQEKHKRKSSGYMNLFKRGSFGRDDPYLVDQKNERIKHILLEGFINFVSDILGHYRGHIDANKSINRETFSKEIPQLEKFIKTICGSQLFEQFILDDNVIEKRKSLSDFRHYKDFQEDQLYLREGYLNKYTTKNLKSTIYGIGKNNQGDHGSMSTKYFKLTRNCLSYYHKGKSEASGSIALNQINSLEKMDSCQGFDQCIEIKTDQDVWILQTGDTESWDIWYFILEWRLNMIINVDKVPTRVPSREIKAKQNNEMDIVTPPPPIKTNEMVIQEPIQSPPIEPPGVPFKPPPQLSSMKASNHERELPIQPSLKKPISTERELPPKPHVPVVKSPSEKEPPKPIRKFPPPNSKKGEPIPPKRPVIMKQPIAKGKKVTPVPPKRVTPRTLPPPPES